MARVKRVSLLFCASGALAAAGCGGKSNQDSAAPPGQVIAHVGATDVTIQELENELRLANISVAKPSDDVTKRILGELVARKYLVQQAVEAKLDREAPVYLAILRSREQVLAGAALQQHLAPKLLPIDNQMLWGYRADHPSQFSEREMLTIEKIEIDIDQNGQAIVDATKDFKTLEPVEKVLTNMHVPYARSSAVIDSGNVSKEFLAMIEAKQADDIFFVRSGLKGTFFKVTGKQSDPLTGQEAAAKARQLLTMDLIKAETEQTVQRAIASTKFVGDYARIMGEHPHQEEGGPKKSESTTPQDGK
jgi:EpsD family peptidyl-prolyl cis-trans isomerase